MSALLEVKDLSKYFISKRGIISKFNTYIKAVDKISYTLNKGEVLTIVGESGCGKTTLGRTTTRVYDVTSGSITFNDIDITELSQKGMFDLRKQMQMVFKNPDTSLNPRKKIGKMIEEAITTHYSYESSEKDDEIESALAKVGLNGDFADKYPHELSPVQKQRVGIARALAVEPIFLVCDEPASALDISVQGQIINLLEELRDELDLTYLFIANDLAMVRYISTHIAIMYLGKLIEKAPVEELYSNPQHPYTQAFLSASDIMNVYSHQRVVLRGDMPLFTDNLSGCKFKDRCSIKKPICSEQEPELQRIDDEHYVACFMSRV